MKRGFLLKAATANVTANVGIDQNIELREYTLKRSIGQGNFSETFLASHLPSGMTMAVKIIEKARLARLGKEKEVLMEKWCLLKCNPHLYLDDPVKMKVFKNSDIQPQRIIHQDYCPNHVVALLRTFQTPAVVGLATEFCDGGELWNRIKFHGLLRRESLRHLAAQILSGLMHLASRSISHRDLKAENLLLKGDPAILRIADFGSALDYSQEIEETVAGNSRRQVMQSVPRTRDPVVFRHFVGTPNFMPPSAMRNREPKTRHGHDIWSLGCTLYQISTGVPPFGAPSEYLIFLRALDQDWDVPAYMDERLFETIKLCTTIDETQRPSPLELRAHYPFRAGSLDQTSLPYYCTCQLKPPDEFPNFSFGDLKRITTLWPVWFAQLKEHVAPQMRRGETTSNIAEKEGKYEDMIFIVFGRKLCESNCGNSYDPGVMQSLSGAEGISWVLRKWRSKFDDTEQTGDVITSVIEYLESDNSATETGEWIKNESFRAFILELYSRLAFSVYVTLSTGTREDGYWERLSAAHLCAASCEDTKEDQSATV